jgi:hypothetical protein
MEEKGRLRGSWGAFWRSSVRGSWLVRTEDGGFASMDTVLIPRVIMFQSSGYSARGLYLFTRGFFFKGDELDLDDFYILALRFGPRKKRKRERERELIRCW